MRFVAIAVVLFFVSIAASYAAAPYCGDNHCNGNEDSSWCPTDCPVAPAPYCGDNHCNGNEDSSWCPTDCPAPAPDPTPSPSPITCAGGKHPGDYCNDFCVACGVSQNYVLDNSCGCTIPSNTYSQSSCNSCGSWCQSACTSTPPPPSCTVKNVCQNGNVYRQNADCSSTIVELCSSGCSNGACITPPPQPSCTVKNICVSGNVYRQNADCTASLVQTCSNGCSNGMCINVPPPPPSCQVKYQCSGNDIVRTNSDCSSSFVKSCEFGCQQIGGDAVCKNAPMCPYHSTQARIKGNDGTYTNHIAIAQGESVRVYGFHNNQLTPANDVSITISGPKGGLSVSNGALFTPQAAGFYTVRASTGTFTEAACTGSAIIEVEARECDPLATAPQVVSCGVMCGTQTLFCNSQGKFERTACTTQGVCVPGAQDTSACQVGGYRTCSSSCQWNACQQVGVCTPGAVEAQACGDHCGLKYRTCASNGQWNDFGPCTGEGVCRPGENESISCGIDGKKSRTCNAACEWDTYGVCQENAACRPGQIDDRSCGKCGIQTRVCLTNGQYSDFGACTGQGVCYAGESEDRACGVNGTQSRYCTSSCQWSGFGYCETPKECTPGQTRSSACGNCGTATDVCSSSGHWKMGACQSQGVCKPGASDSQSCGIDGTKERTCTNSCQWSAFGQCSDSSVCHPGETKTEACGMCGVRVLVCNSQGQYDVGSCEDEHGSCVAGSTQTEACGVGGSMSRTCSRSCEWGPYSACSSSQSCSPGQIQQEACGSSGLGICSKGVSTRVCGSSGNWGSWSACVGNTEPRSESCNGRDDDCDGHVDEGVVCEYLQVSSVQVINGDCVNPGDDLYVRVVLDNLGDEDFEDLKVTVSSDQLDVFARTEVFDIDDGDTETILVPAELPLSIAPGIYDVRVAVGNELQIRRVIYRDFVVTKTSCLV